MHRLRRR
jgi:hypothetical protein